jgi:hypothetical protein
MFLQNTSSSFSYETFPGSKTTWTTSACPVTPAATCSYVGFTSFPPA